jgi:hypothetical protein
MVGHGLVGGGLMVLHVNGLSRLHRGKRRFCADSLT